MNISSGLNTVSSLYGQQKSNYMKAPASAEKTFYTAETPKVYQIFTTDNMLWTGGNGTGLSYCLKYADDSTDENPVVLAKGVDENGKEFEQRIYINDVNPSNATVKMVLLLQRMAQIYLPCLRKSLKMAQGMNFILIDGWNMLRMAGKKKMI